MASSDLWPWGSLLLLALHHLLGESSCCSWWQWHKLCGEEQTTLTELQALGKGSHRPQPLPAPPHKHRHPSNPPQKDSWGQSHLPWADYLSSPLEAPAGGKRDAQRKSRWVPGSNGWCCAASHWRPLLQHSKTTAGHCTSVVAAPMHCCFVCWRCQFPYTWNVACWSMCLAGVIILRDAALTHPALTYPQIYWFDMTGLTIQVTFLHMTVLFLCKHNSEEIWLPSRSLGGLCCQGQDEVNKERPTQPLKILPCCSTRHVQAGNESFGWSGNNLGQNMNHLATPPRKQDRCCHRGSKYATDCAFCLLSSSEVTQLTSKQNICKGLWGKQN